LKTSHDGIDSIYSQENKNRIAAIESRQAIALRDQQLQINRLTINSQRQQRSLLIAGIAVLFCLAAGLYILSRLRKRTAFKLQVLNKELDQANKTKAMFFAILSHDLRGPVSSLISLTELEEASVNPFNDNWAIKNRKLITDRGKNLLNTMDTLLFWSKGQMKQFQLVKESFPVSRLFDELRDAFQWEDRTIITFSNPDGLMIFSDPNYCRIILHNLTANSIKILQNVPHGHIVWTASALSGQVQLSITDNGPGIATTAIQTLQHDSVTPNSQTGFGLHMIRDLAKAIDCRIAVDTQPAIGTTIRLFFNL
jgi:signal transduction histidine kinase